MRYILNLLFYMISWSLVAALATCSVMFCIDKDRIIFSGITCFLMAFFIAWPLVPLTIRWNKSPWASMNLELNSRTCLRGFRWVVGLILSITAVSAFMRKSDYPAGGVLLLLGLILLSPLDKVIFVRYRSIIPAFSVRPLGSTAIILSGI